MFVILANAATVVVIVIAITTSYVIFFTIFYCIQLPQTIFNIYYSTDFYYFN